MRSRALESIDIQLAHQGLQAFQTAVASESYDMIILDEINVALHFGLLNIEDVLAIIRNKPTGLHLILTGRNAKKALLLMADLITEMQEVKHHYQNGVPAQIGIEM